MGKVTPAVAVNNYQDITKRKPEGYDLTNQNSRRSGEGQKVPAGEVGNYNPGPAAEYIPSRRPEEIQSVDDEGKISAKPRSNEGE